MAKINNISVTEPITPAIERVKMMLFRPFDMNKWFTVGFCAWLAFLSQGGGSNFPIRAMNTRSMGEGGPGNSMGPHLQWLIPVLIIVGILSIALMLVMLWLSSRGKFMFLYSVAENQTQVKIPWRYYAQQANNLFIFKLVAGLIAFFVMAILAGVIIFFISLSNTTAGSGPTVLAVLTGLILGMPIIIAISIFFKFTNDFAVPLMYLRGYTCLEAWREFVTLLFDNKGSFALYVLFQIVIGMAISMIVLVAVLVTCCIAGIIMAIPYIGTVLMLPVLVFQRSYSLYFFSQFGNEFDVFPHPEAEPV